MTALTLLNVLGEVATLTPPGGPAHALERKAAGLMAYLALEGTASRTLLAGLLWPDMPEGRARANLRQTVHRLRAPHGPVVQGDPLLSLVNVQVDIQELERAAFAGQEEQVIASGGELLGTYDYADCPDFTDWLQTKRQRLLHLRTEAHARLERTAEAHADLKGALEHTLTLLELDPLNEAVHRQVMHLHVLNGDRRAAWQAFQHCRDVLQHELGVPLLPETLALAAQIGQEHGPTPLPALPALRQGLQHPPVLVGREREWAELQTAWDSRQTILVGGPAGIGKTRLLRDFLASKGPFVDFQVQPSDIGGPYGPLTRLFRHLLSCFPDVTLPEWVRAQLATLLPELGPPAAPVQGRDELRFLEAQAQFLVQLAHAGLTHLLLDNIHLTGVTSFQSGLALHAHPAVQRAGVRMILLFREDELPDGLLQDLRRAAAHRSLHLMSVAPLSQGSVEALLGSLNWPHTPDMTATLTRYTGGNPLSILEILRHLLETGQLNGPLPAPLPIPATLNALVTRRLERLSLEARSLARTAAVAGQEFNLSLAAAVMERTPLELAEPWAELKAAHLLEDAGFTHGLLEDITLQHVPAPIRAWLHQRVAQELRKSPAREATPL